MIQTKELIYEYEKRDEEGNIIAGAGSYSFVLE